MRPAAGDAGSLTWQAPSSGAILGREDGTLVTRCSGVLVGCDTFLTAAHCVCGGELTAGTCTVAEQPVVLLQHGGLLPAADVHVHPAYDYPVADLAIVHLDPQATGIVPALVAAGAPSIGSPGTVVGFGRSGHSTVDPGLKRLRPVTTAQCPEGYQAEWLCWDFTDTAPRICDGNGGTPLMFDDGTGASLIGLGLGFTRFLPTRAAPLCIVAGAGLDADLSTYLPWLLSEGATDVEGTRCGNIPQVGETGTSVTTIDGLLGPTRSSAEHTVIVTPNTQLLRVVLNGQDSGASGPHDLDLFVRARDSKHLDDYCAGTDTGPYAVCEFSSPRAGAWDMRVDRIAGAGHYQLTATAFGADTPRCGNGLREVGEECDGADRPDCEGGCTVDCACAACVGGDLEFDEVQFTRRFFLKGTLNDPTGDRWAGIDPRAGGFTLTISDEQGAMVQVTIPPNDPGWAGSRPRDGLFRWRGLALGVRRITLQARTRGSGWWRILIDGQDVLGAPTLGFNALRFTIGFGSRCALKAFP